MERNGDEEIALLNRLLELLHQAGGEQKGSNLQLVYVAKGAQYVNNMYNQHPLPASRQKKNEANIQAPAPFDSGTPLSALFRESHHEELKEMVKNWRLYMIEEGQTEDELILTSFQFDFEQIRPVNIYMDLAHLINHDALRVPMSVLAAYMFQHSNLSKSENALYVQLKRYRNMCK